MYNLDMNNHDDNPEQTIIEFGPHLFEIGGYLFIAHGAVMISDDAPEELKEIYAKGKSYFDRMYLRYLYLYNRYRCHAITPRKNIEELSAYCIEHLGAEYIGVLDDPYLLNMHIRNLKGFNPAIREEELEFTGYRIAADEEAAAEEDGNSIIVFEKRHDYFGTWNQKVLRELAYQRGIDPAYLDTFNEDAWNYLIACDFYFSHD
jgi:hypothetical protein